MASDDSVNLVVAFDVGTAFSGYAYAFSTDKDDIFLNKPWPGPVTVKTNTSVLLDANGEFDSFGYDAEEKYSALSPDKQKSYQLFDKFKMTLDKDNLYGEPVEVTSRTGKVKDGIEIFALALWSMRNRLLDFVSESHKSYPPKLSIDSEATHRKSNSLLDKSFYSFYDLNVDTGIKWVITVPAIWSEGAKQFMRRVAVKAGIIDVESSPRLVIALEPEAASIYLRNLVVHKFDKRNKGQTLDEGVEYVIIDCGGGTIDVTAHKVIANGCVREIYRATGGPWGGMNVNLEFEQLIKRALGHEFVEHYKVHHPGDWFAFLTEFEKKKRGISTERENLGVTIGYELGSEFENFSISHGNQPYKIQEKLAQINLPGIFYSGGKINVEGEALANLFDPVVGKIVKHMQGLLLEGPLKSVTHIVLVGGFSNSPFLRRTIRNEFENNSTGKKYTVLLSEEPEIAVMKGAVIYGINPPAISSRVARYTYGYDVDDVFKPFHDEARKVYNEHHKEFYCRDCFHTLIKKGESINYADVRTGYCHPLNPTQSEFDFKFLAIDREQVMYADEKGVIVIGKLDFNSRNVSKGLDRSFRVDFTFGGTEIKVRVSEVNSHSEENVTLKLN